jgi:hypothetical protein
VTDDKNGDDIICGLQGNDEILDEQGNDVLMVDIVEPPAPVTRPPYI